MIKDNAFIRQLNHRAIEDFEDFTPTEMHGLLHYPFDTDKSPLRLNINIDPQLLNKAIFYKDILQYLHMIRDKQPMKLTQKGNLPRAFCRELVEKNIIEKDRFWFEYKSIGKEEDSYYISLINRITRLGGLTKKRYGKITLTKMCMRYLDLPSGELFRNIFTCYKGSSIGHFPTGILILGSYRVVLLFLYF